MIDRAQKHILASIETKHLIYEQCMDSILQASEMLIQAFQNGNKLLLCGNGGSAADCQHMATELVSKLSIERRGLPAIALTTDTSFLTAYSNDYSFSDVFQRQVSALGNPDDVLIAISTSGTSVNIGRALSAAKEKRLKTIALIGGNSDITKWRLIDTYATVSIKVPSTNTQYIQESHLMIEHILCDLVEQSMFGDLKASGTSWDMGGMMT